MSLRDELAQVLADQFGERNDIDLCDEISADALLASEPMQAIRKAMLAFAAEVTAGDYPTKRQELKYAYDLPESVVVWLLGDES